MAQRSPSVQEYFLPGHGLSRYIVVKQLHYVLGPHATLRPYSFKGREGYLIRGSPLTKEQIEDLKRQSREYERQQTRRNAASLSEEEPDINQPIMMTRPAQNDTYRRYR